MGLLFDQAYFGLEPKLKQQLVFAYMFSVVAGQLVPEMMPRLVQPTQTRLLLASIAISLVIPLANAYASGELVKLRPSSLLAFISIFYALGSAVWMQIYRCCAELRPEELQAPCQRLLNVVLEIGILMGVLQSYLTNAMHRSDDVPPGC
eukprot:SAG31_NODE_7225_length_1750_cov_1.313749_1_plen_149_part_00